MSSSADHRPGQSLDEDHDNEERETEQNESANGEDHLEGLVLERGSGDQVAELGGHPDGHVERDDHCPDDERGRVVDPCGADEDRRGHDSQEPGEEDLLGGGQPILQRAKRLLHRHWARCQREPILAASPPGAQMTSALVGGPSGLTMWFTTSGGLT